MDIIIKPADKGEAIVIQNKEDYITEGERQLEQQQHYKKLDNFEKNQQKFIKEVETSLRSLLNREYIDDDTLKYCTDPTQELQISIYYPKSTRRTIHEDQSSTV